MIDPLLQRAIDELRRLPCRNVSSTCEHCEIIKAFDLRQAADIASRWDKTNKEISVEKRK